MIRHKNSFVRGRSYCCLNWWTAATGWWSVSATGLRTRRRESTAKSEWRSIERGRSPTSLFVGCASVASTKPTRISTKWRSSSSLRGRTPTRYRGTPPLDTHSLCSTSTPKSTRTPKWRRGATKQLSSRRRPSSQEVRRQQHQRRKFKVNRRKSIAATVQQYERKWVDITCREMKAKKVKF